MPTWQRRYPWAPPPCQPGKGDILGAPLLAQPGKGAALRTVHGLVYCAWVLWKRRWALLLVGPGLVGWPPWLCSLWSAVSHQRGGAGPRRRESAQKRPLGAGCQLVVHGGGAAGLARVAACLRVTPLLALELQVVELVCVKTRSTLRNRGCRNRDAAGKSVSQSGSHVLHLWRAGNQHQIRASPGPQAKGGAWQHFADPAPGGAVGQLVVGGAQPGCALAPRCVVQLAEEQRTDTN